MRRTDIVLQIVGAGAPAGGDADRSTERASLHRRAERSPTPHPFTNVYIRYEGFPIGGAIPEEPLATRFHWLKGKDPSGWRSDIPTFGRIRLVSSGAGGSIVLEAGGADLLGRFEAVGGACVLRPRPILETTAGVRATPDGFSLSTSFGLYAIRSGVRWADADGASGEAAAYSDPRASALMWGTYLGGSETEGSWKVLLDGSENVIVGGQTESADMPAPNGFDGTWNAWKDLYVAKISASGDALLWGTFLGGSWDDLIDELGSFPSGNLVVVGYTASDDIPTPSGYDTTRNGRYDIYVAKLDPTGSFVHWGTYLGGSGDDIGYALAIDSDRIFVAGYTTSTDAPIPGALDPTPNGSDDIYLASLGSTDGVLGWATYLGGSGWDIPDSLAVDGQGNVIVGAGSDSPDCPLLNPMDSTSEVNGDIYLAKVSRDGSALLWGTYLGGSGYEGAAVLLPAGDDGVILGGMSSSPDMPVPGAYDATHNGDLDFYIAKLTPGQPGPDWATYLGGSGQDWLRGLARDGQGNLFAVGSSDSDNVPVSNAVDSTRNGSSDIYVAGLSAGGDALLWGTYLGGTKSDGGDSVAVTPGGEFVVSAFTRSSDIPTPGGFDNTFGGPGQFGNAGDIYVARFAVSQSVLPGDADGDGAISIGEVQQSINMFLGIAPPGNGVDCSDDGTVSIGEVQKVINGFLGIESSCG